MASSSASRGPGGGRQTQQRAAIRAAFCEPGRPLTVSEVLERAQETVPSLNQATVYRNLNLLVKNGWLIRIAHPEAGSLYERAGRGHHHHFYCRSCSCVFELPGCPLPDYHGPAGYVTEGHALFFHGLCRECVPSGGESAAPRRSAAAVNASAADRE